MKRNRSLLFVVSALVLFGGCVSLSARMQSFMGRPDTELVSRWGAPDRKVTLSDSSVVMTWDNFAGCVQNLTFSKTGIAERWSMSRGCGR